MAEPVTIAICGDVMLGRLVNKVIARQGITYPWGNVQPLLAGADACLINQEFALTASHERWLDRGREKAFYFRAEPEVVESLAYAGVDFASLANNHIGDFGTVGLLDTLTTLDAAGIAHAGAGANDRESAAPAFIQVGEWRVGVVAFADHPREWAATAGGPGLNYTPVSLDPSRFRRIEAALAAARAGADLVIFSIHWGPNMRERPPGRFQEFARRVIDAGADLFWGHSAHIVQGIEVRRGQPILYDTGDFVDDYAVDPRLRNDLSALILLRAAPPEIVGLEIVPVTIDQMQVNLAEGDERNWLIDRITELSGEFGTRFIVDPDRSSVEVALDGRGGTRR